MTAQGQAGPIYIASRASLPERAQRWRRLRDDYGWQIISSWIDEAGEGDTVDFTDLWDRVQREVSASNKLVLYAEPDDFPLKGALIEVGMALALGKPVVVCLPRVLLQKRSLRPVGSWLNHRNVLRLDSLEDALGYVNTNPARPIGSDS
jgi:hypothetical protein